MQGSPKSGVTTGSLQNIPEGEYTGFDKSQGSWPKEQLTFLDDPTVFLAIELVSSLSGYYSFFVCSTLDPSFLPSCLPAVKWSVYCVLLNHYHIYLCFYSQDAHNPSFFPSGRKNHYLKKKKKSMSLTWTEMFHFIFYPIWTLAAYQVLWSTLIYIISFNSPCWLLETCSYPQFYLGGNKHREGNGTPLQYSCLENPMDGGAW